MILILEEYMGLNVQERSYLRNLEKVIFILIVNFVQNYKSLSNVKR